MQHFLYIVLLLTFRNNMKPGLMMHLLMSMMLTSVTVQMITAKMDVIMPATMQQDEQQEIHVTRRRINEVVEMKILLYNYFTRNTRVILSFLSFHLFLML